MTSVFEFGRKPGDYWIEPDPEQPGYNRGVYWIPDIFQLGRMRHLDLLAMWHRLNPDGHIQTGDWVAAASKEQIITLIADQVGAR